MWLERFFCEIDGGAREPASRLWCGFFTCEPRFAASPLIFAENWRELGWHAPCLVLPRKGRHMKKGSLGFLGFVLAAAVWSAKARADEEVVNDEQLDLSLTLNEPFDPAPSYVDFERQYLERSARSSRNALIGTSVAMAVGAAIYFPLVINCIDFSTVEGSSPKCGRGAEAGIITSTILLTGGAVGTIVTGIMYGVRKGKMRRLDDRAKNGRGRAVRFDADRGSFVF